MKNASESARRSSSSILIHVDSTSGARDTMPRIVIPTPSVQRASDALPIVNSGVSRWPDWMSPNSM
jgi:hypothetical protein